MPEPQSLADTNYRWAYALFDGLIAGGLSQVVVSPGSRSTPLALAASRHPKLNVRVVLDERVAAFFALGMAKETGLPVALVATSGTAVTEWLPAVTEADLSRIPLLLLSADRPQELRQCGANQTIQQNGLFSSQTRYAMELPLPDEALMQAAAQYAGRASAAAQWPLAGPVHLNIPFREPLTPSQGILPQPVKTIYWSKPLLQFSEHDVSELVSKISGRPGLIVCGPDVGEALPAIEIAKLAKSLSSPILADPLSNLRCSLFSDPHLISLYDGCLKSEAFATSTKPEWVIRFGAMPVSKVLNAYLENLLNAQHIVVDASGRWTDALHQVDMVLQADPAAVAEALSERVSRATDEWLSHWQQRQDEVEAHLRNASPPEAEMLDTIGQSLPEGVRVFSGNSLAIRQFDWFFKGRSQAMKLLCNRGASGIDGNVATVLGIAAVSEQPVVAVLGDLSLQHDIAAFAEAVDLNAVFILLDNGGGGIFDYLPQSALEEHEALFITPRNANFKALATGFGIHYCETSQEQFGRDLKKAIEQGGVSLLHLKIDRHESLQKHRDFWASISN